MTKEVDVDLFHLDEEGNWRANGVSLPESGIGTVSDIQIQSILE